MKRITQSLLVSGLLALSSAALAAPFQISSDSFSNGGVAPLSMGGGGKCPGNNTSPQLSWSNAPAGTKSFVLLIEDPQGANGLGVMHFIGYGIDASRDQFASGELAKKSLYTSGINVRGGTGYAGPCPPANADVHNYNFTLIATDLDTHALSQGMDKAELAKHLKGHTLAAAGIVARYELSNQ